VLTEQPYRPAGGPPPTERRTQPNPWPLIAGVVVLAVLAGILALVLLTRDQDRGAVVGSGTPTPSGSASPSATPDESAVASPTASPTAGGEAPELAAFELLSVIEPVVEGVSLREEPRTNGERIGTLAPGSPNIVIEGPVDGDAYQWYRLAGIGLPPSSGCVTPLPTDPLECPVWYGWAAGGDPEAGTPWFRTVEPDCPDPDGETRDFLSLPQRMPLACYRDEISFTAWYPDGPRGGGGQDCDPDPAIAWLYCNGVHDVWPDEEEAGILTFLFVDPDSGVTMPERGQWLRVSGAYDHPDAAACAEANEQVGLYRDDDELAVLECRTRLVVTAVEVTAAP
jgi:hypothetical protein